MYTIVIEDITKLYTLFELVTWLRRKLAKLSHGRLLKEPSNSFQNSTAKGKKKKACNSPGRT